MALIPDGVRKIAHNPPYFIEYLRKLYWSVRGIDRFHGKYAGLRLLSADETVRLLLERPLSFVRFADGEMEILRGGSIYYPTFQQRHDPLLQKRVREIFDSDPDRVLLGLCTTYLRMNTRELKRVRKLKVWVQSFFGLDSLVDPGRTYGDAMALRENLNLDVGALLRFFKTKDVVIVTGASNVERLKNLPIGATLRFVPTPAHNAWEAYPEILAAVERIIRDERLDPARVLFLVSLGPTAKPLVLDLVARGFQAWDTGHFFDMFYEKMQDAG